MKDLIYRCLLTGEKETSNINNAEQLSYLWENRSGEWKLWRRDSGWAFGARVTCVHLLGHKYASGAKTLMGNGDISATYHLSEESTAMFSPPPLWICSQWPEHINPLGENQSLVLQISMKSGSPAEKCPSLIWLLKAFGHSCLLSFVTFYPRIEYSRSF